MNDLLKWLRAQQEGHRATECRVPAPTTSEFFKAAADEIERLQDRNTELANALSFMTDALDREQSEETDDWEITDIRWREKIDQLQASVKKVPKTADGVPAYPGMGVWFWNSHAVIRQICDGGEYGYTVEVEDADGPQGWVPLVKCYSTKVAEAI